MYELFILGELKDQPLHGYLLREIINLAIGPTRQMSWGALYPLMRRLEGDGLIEQAPELSDAGERRRNVYRITPNGIERFYFLLLRPEDYTADYSDVFNVKLINFDHLTPLQRKDVLGHYLHYARSVWERLTQSRRYVTAEVHITPAEKPWVLKNLDHRIQIASADLEWAEKELEKL